MNRLALIIFLVLANATYTFAEDWVGQTVFPKARDTKLRYETEIVSSFSFKAKVVRDNGDWVEVRHDDVNDKFPNRYQGYVKKKDVVLARDAVSYFTALITADRGNAWAYQCRAEARQLKGEHTSAIADLTEAVRRTRTTKTYIARGIAWQNQGEYEKAVADFTEAIRLDPKDAVAHNNRGFAWYGQREYAKAIADFSEATRLMPKFALAYNNLAWLLATCPDKKFRDAERAIKNATQACELTDWKQPNHLDTLAAAYATANDFSNAVKWQKKAIELTPDASKADLGTRLELYEDGKPYVQAADSASSP